MKKKKKKREFNVSLWYSRRTSMVPNKKKYRRKNKHKNPNWGSFFAQNF